MKYILFLITFITKIIYFLFRLLCYFSNYYHLFFLDNQLLHVIFSIITGYIFNYFKVYFQSIKIIFSINKHYIFNYFKVYFESLQFIFPIITVYVFKYYSICFQLLQIIKSFYFSFVLSLFFYVMYCFGSEASLGPITLSLFVVNLRLFC